MRGEKIEKRALFEAGEYSTGTAVDGDSGDAEWITSVGEGSGASGGMARGQGLKPGRGGREREEADVATDANEAEVA